MNNPTSLNTNRDISIQYKCPTTASLITYIQEGKEYQASSILLIILPSCLLMIDHQLIEKSRPTSSKQESRE